MADAFQVVAVTDKMGEWGFVSSTPTTPPTTPESRHAAHVSDRQGVGLRPPPRSDQPDSCDHKATDDQRQPRRYLDPNLADAVARAKKASGMTWRVVARRVGVTHGHLVNISKGRRVPSRRTVEGMARVLPIEGGALARLRVVATHNWEG
jgi:ribosome-binding protein aMBF1 (putative translation factor)